MAVGGLALLGVSLWAVGLDGCRAFMRFLAAYAEVTAHRPRIVETVEIRRSAVGRLSGVLSSVGVGGDFDGRSRRRRGDSVADVAAMQRPAARLGHCVGVDSGAQPPFGRLRRRGADSGRVSCRGGRKILTPIGIVGHDRVSYSLVFAGRLGDGRR